jgi:benzoyl-CoA reductase/2-hydroxyglutaryl-CoA dehydratase subunit BcrC/BadD/HgdB
MTALELFKQHYEDRHRSAMAWKASGGKVVGYLCDNVPDELIAAAGFFPLRISGDPLSDGRATRTLVDSLYPPDVATRPDFVTSILDRLLDGTYEFLDFLIVPHNRNAIQSIYRELSDARRRRPDLPTFPCYYLDKAWSSSFVSESYNRDELLRLKAQLEAWSGAQVTDPALAAAVAEANRGRRLLAEVAGLRAARPSRLSGVEALQIFGSSMVMRRADHNHLLEDFLNTASQAPPREGPRVFLGGSPLDHTRIYEAIESCGATVVAEDHCWGNRIADLPVDEGVAPLLGLAERFHRRPACSITIPLKATVEGCAMRAAMADVDAAIFYVIERDWSQNWETPGEVSALEGRGVPTLHLKGQAYDGGDPVALRRKVSEFLDTVRAGPRDATTMVGTN